MRRNLTGNYEEKLSQEIISQYISSREKCGNYRELHGAKEGGREGYREGVREIKGNRERDGE